MKLRKKKTKKNDGSVSGKFGLVFFNGFQFFQI